MRELKYPIALLVFVIILAVWVLAAKSAEPDPAAPFKAICELKHKSGSTGSGTLVAREGNVGLILSCRHVNTTTGSKVKVSFLNAGFWSEGVVVHVHEGNSFQNDLALVIAPVPLSLEPVKVVDFDPNNGPWVSVGFRDGKFLVGTATKARLTENTIKMEDHIFLGGMSGGATLDKYGRLVGVVVASNSRRRRATTWWALSVDGKNLKSMLELTGRR